MKTCDQCNHYFPANQLNETSSGILCDTCFESWKETADESTIRANPEIWPNPEITLLIIDHQQRMHELFSEHLRKVDETLERVKSLIQ